MSLPFEIHTMITATSTTCPKKPMKHLILSIAALTVCLSQTHGQGVIYFDTSGAAAPLGHIYINGVLDTTQDINAELLTSTNFFGPFTPVAELLLSSGNNSPDGNAGFDSSDIVSALGDISSNGDGSLTDQTYSFYFLSQPVGSTAYFEVKAWTGNGVNSYAAAQAMFLPTAVSTVFTETLGSYNTAIPGLAMPAINLQNAVLLGPAFYVTNMQPKPNGVTISFNLPIVTNYLTFYGTSNTPSFTLVGNTSGPIGGSLLFDPQLLSVSFVDTTAPLRPDSYTVSLTSHLDSGFVDIYGDPFSSNGVPAGNYVAQFTINPSTDPILLSAPQLTFSNTYFSFFLSGSPGSNYVLQSSTNLLNWSPLSTSTVPASGSVNLTNSTSGSKQRYYRACWQ